MNICLLFKQIGSRRALRNYVHFCLEIEKGQERSGTGTLSAQGGTRSPNDPFKLLVRRKLISLFFTAIVTADHFSRAYQASTHPDEGFEDETARARAEAKSRQTAYERFMDFGKEHRYQIVGGSWVASMAIALGLVGRSPYLSTQQKLVQARVYAQGLTVAVLIATAIFEVGDQNKGEGRWETIKVLDPNDPEHKHLVEKKIHHERYAGEDQWKGMRNPIHDTETQQQDADRGQIWWRQKKTR